MMSTWLRISLLLVIACGAAACGFPRPQDVGDDAAPGSCTSDDDCDGNAPACVDGTCAVCRVSDTCPASAPVCDVTSHDCRTCLKDSECESGACDLAAGTCVGQGQILYASPNGGDADMCTRNAPCSFTQAALTVNAVHPYIVLLPGVHTGSAHFEAKDATVCGNGASINATFSSIVILNQSSIQIRDLTLFQDPISSALGAGFIIRSSNSELTLDNTRIQTNFLIGIGGGPKITVRDSIFTGAASFSVFGQVIIDRSTFLSKAGISFTDGGMVGFLAVTNSLFVSEAGLTAIRIHPDSPTAATNASISNNTIIGGVVECNGDASYDRLWSSNILYNTSGLKIAPGCNYSYNLITPATAVGGTGNFAADPLFVDAANNDFHLKTGSPAIDAANPAQTAPSGRDRDGTPRPQGLRFDIGAFEYRP